MVPEAAVVQRGESAFVYTVTDNKAAEVKVRLGKRLPGKIEILEGIAAGDTVVTAGNARSQQWRRGRSRLDRRRVGRVAPCRFQNFAFVARSSPPF